MIEVYIVYQLLLDRIFNNKELPGFSVERRIDTIFSFFLGEILTTYFGSDRQHKIELVIQEFPLKNEDDENNRPKFLDYLCTDRVNNKIYYVELKTDNESWDKNQLENYNKNKDWIKVVNKLKVLIKKTEMKKKLKYLYLLEQLYQYGLIRYLDEDVALSLIYKIKNENQRINQNINDFLELIVTDKKDIQIICIGPSGTGVPPINCDIKFIPFQDFTGITTLNYSKEWELLKVKLEQL